MNDNNPNISYKEFKIHKSSEGMSLNDNYHGKIVKFLVTDEHKTSIFAFFVPFKDLVVKKEIDFSALAEQTIKSHVDELGIENEKEITYDFDGDSNSFILNPNAKWWIYAK